MPLVEFTTLASPQVVGVIRRTVIPLLSAALRLTPGEAGDLELMVSELVTNAYLHGCRGKEGTKLGIKADAVGGGRVRVEVTDPAVPAVRGHQRRNTAEGGRGLIIIDKLAKDCGNKRDRKAGTRTSWFEMEVAALLPTESEGATAAAVSSTEAAPTPGANTTALSSRIRHARPAMVVGAIGPKPISAAA
ncbi:ATP-binding protein [Kitasatospora sp. NPDC094028]